MGRLEKKVDWLGKLEINPIKGEYGKVYFESAYSGLCRKAYKSEISKVKSSGEGPKELKPAEENPGKDYNIRNKGSFYLKIGVLIAFLLPTISAITIPKFKTKPIKPSTERIVKTVELPEQMKQLKEPPPPPKPKMPVEAETEEEVEAVTIETTEFTGFEKVPPKPKTLPPAFVPYDTPPKEKFIFKPNYPEIARKAGIEGTVYLQVAVDPEGNVIGVKVVKGLHELLDKSAMEAAWKWKYYPAKQRDMPVAVWIGQPVTFKLTEE